jgi:hypothetical protein
MERQRTFDRRITRIDVADLPADGLLLVRGAPQACQQEIGVGNQFENWIWCGARSFDCGMLLDSFRHGQLLAEGQACRGGDDTAAGRSGAVDRRGIAPWAAT